MGKIIEFTPKMPEHIENTEGIRLYYKYYKTANEVKKNWITQTISMHLCNSIDDRSFIRKMEPQDVLELYGYAAARMITEKTQAVSAYYKKLGKVIEKYGIEVFANVGSN